MADARIATFTNEAEKVHRFLQQEYGTLQTGRASAALVEHISVDAYGQKMQIKAVAGISIQDARTIVIQPWDAGMLGPIEKAVQQSSLGVNPVNDGSVLRLHLPPMTEERRLQLKKLVHSMAEEARITIRQHRQKAHDAIKQEPNETLKNSLQDQLQKEVDTANGRIEELMKHKEEEIMKI